MKKTVVILVLFTIFPISASSLHVSNMTKILSYNNLKKQAFHFVGKRMATRHYTSKITQISHTIQRINEPLKASTQKKDKKDMRLLHLQYGIPTGLFTGCLDLIQCCGTAMRSAHD